MISEKKSRPRALPVGRLSAIRIKKTSLPHSSSCNLSIHGESMGLPVPGTELTGLHSVEFSQKRLKSMLFCLLTNYL